MKSNNTHFVHQTAKTVLITSVAIALLLPPSLAAADSTSVSSNTVVTQVSAQAPTTTTTSDKRYYKSEIHAGASDCKAKRIIPIPKKRNGKQCSTGI